MEQQSSTSKVTVEYFDPHDVFKLLAPGLMPRLPLHNLHWQSHSGPLRSIDTLHVELIKGDDDAVAPPTKVPGSRSGSITRDDGFQTQNVGGRPDSTDTIDTGSLSSKIAASQRRHQIPGLRRTPYLKVLLVRCDDNDSYKSSVRAEIREWIKTQTPPSTSSKKSKDQEKHDAFEWLIIHVVIPNTAAATQPRSGSVSKSSESGTSEKSSSRWRTGSTPLMEKLRSDFNSSGKGAVDRVTQIRIGINDVPYDLLPRVVPAVPTGYSESEQDAEKAWDDLMAKLKSQILTSFDMRVTQYEEDIKERDGQRSLPGWNFCTFFILKEGLARGFENVGLVDDALVGYDELSIGLDAVLQEQAETGQPERHGGAMLGYTEELRAVAERALAVASGGNDEDEEAVDLQSKETPTDQLEQIPISSTKKAYRDMILENKVSVFDFRCYIFSRQVALLLRLGNASSTREELLEKLKEQQESVLHGVAPLKPPTQRTEAEVENLDMLAEVCRRTLQFIPSVSSVMRQDVQTGLTAARTPVEGKSRPKLKPSEAEVVDNIVVSFAFAVAQQILAQTITKALPIPSSTLQGDGPELKALMPEPKTMMHPARTTSLHVSGSSRPPLSPNIFPGPGRRASVPDGDTQNSQFLKIGLEELAARRADLYMLLRSVLETLGQKRGWDNGWKDAPMIGDADDFAMEEINLDDDSTDAAANPAAHVAEPFVAGIDSHLLRTATDNTDDFYRLYHILTDKALHHYIVANYEHAVMANTADLAILKFKLKEYRAATELFRQTVPAFGADSWTLLELSMLVMFSQCLLEVKSEEEYVRVALTLLTKACEVERERLEQSSVQGGKGSKKGLASLAILEDVVEKLFELASSLPTDAIVPLTNFISQIELASPPEYLDEQDSSTLTISLRNLLPGPIELDSSELKFSAVDAAATCKEVAFEGEGSIVLKPGKNTLKLKCNSLCPCKFEVAQLTLRSNKIVLRYVRDPEAPDPDIFKHPAIRLYQRTGALDVQLRASKHILLDKENSLDLELSTGWNSLKSCELRVRPATAGLRVLTKEAKFVEPSMEFAKPPEAGVFSLGAVPRDSKLTLRFPYSVEQDVGDVSMRMEITYITEAGDKFYLAKSMAVPVSLALGVNVQDVFKHKALFSRFNVSTATSSPLRLYKSELLGSDLFEPAFGVPPANTITVFPKQPASLLYKVTRKVGSKPGKSATKAMYLKLYYSTLHTEVDDAFTASVASSLEEKNLGQYARLVKAAVRAEIKSGLLAGDLERAALLGEMPTAFLSDVRWENHFQGIGHLPNSKDDAGSTLSSVLRQWQATTPRLAIPISSSNSNSSHSTADEPSSILIPVEVPSLSVVHTADIRLHLSQPTLLHEKTNSAGGGGAPTVAINQMIPATLHLKWTRIWDTDAATRREDQEFSYEVTAPSDAWLLGGRRKGHFVIPRATPSGSLSSTPDTEADIPLILIPQREGYLPFPSVDIKPVSSSSPHNSHHQHTHTQQSSVSSAPDGVHHGPGPGTGAGAGGGGDPNDDDDALAQAACEIDWRNLGETVRVVAERKALTVSLDASGAGGGPLVLESEEMVSGDGRIVA